jgi:hypothetical protein
MTEESQDNIDSVIDWFLTSDIYEPKGKYRIYYTENGEGSIYPEITAYAISLAILLYKYKNLKIFLNRAKECSQYLMKINYNGGIPSSNNTTLFTFDTGIFISGLFDIYEITRDDKYLNAARKSLNWLEKVWDGEKFLASDQKINKINWATLSSVHLIKLAIPLLKAYLLLKDDKYRDMTITLLDWGMKFQQHNGRFIMNDIMRDTRIHPHCYATEGYIFAYYYLKEEKYLEVATKSAKWLSSILNNDGSIYGWYFKNKIKNKIRLLRNEKVTDALSQSIRIWKLLGVNENGINKSLFFLSNQLRNGGLPLKKQELPLYKNMKIYSWPTFFYLHALMLPFGKIEYAKEIF